MRIPAVRRRQEEERERAEHHARTQREQLKIRDAVGAVGEVQVV